VRELRNVVERAVYRWDDPESPIAHVQFDPFESPWKPSAPSHRRSESGAAAGAIAADAGTVSASKGAPSEQLEKVDDLRAAVDSHERAILEHALGKHRWNQRQTAKGLGLSYDQLRHAIKKHGLMEGQE